jgi:hypothetical protein
MDYLPDNVRKAFEKYAKGDTEEAFESLIPGSEYHCYLSILEAFKRTKGKLTKKVKDMIDKFKKNWPGFEAEKLELQSYLLEFDNVKTDKERDEIIQTINKNFVHGFYEYSKPAEIKGVKNNRIKDNSRSRSPSIKKANNVFQQEKFFNMEITLKKAYKNEADLGSFQRSLLNKIDYTKISDRSFSTFMNMCPYISELTTPTFMQKLVNFMNNNFKKNKHYPVVSYHLDNLNLSQLEELGSKCPEIRDDKTFIGTAFEKRFHFELDSSNKELFSLEERRGQLIEMYEASNDRPQSFKSALLLEILEIGLKLGIYDKKYFILYLENPLKMWHMNKNRVKRDTQDYAWNSFIGNLQTRQGGSMSADLEAKLYKRYLEQFYREKGDLKEFVEFFNDSFLKSLAEEFYFLSGKEIKGEKIDFDKYEKLANSVIIELLEYNKEEFKPEDRVKINAELKNVPTVHIKIFEFNSLNYYKKNRTPFKTDVNLDGLITSFEKDIDLGSKSTFSTHKKFKHTFEFPELDDKIGLFVIEFISNGYSSRAIIRKGTLSVIYKQRISGQIAYILDHNRGI